MAPNQQDLAIGKIKELLMIFDLIAKSCSFFCRSAYQKSLSAFLASLVFGDWEKSGIAHDF